MQDKAKNCKTFDLLVKNGADIFAKNRNGLNIYEVALQVNNNDKCLEHIK